MAELHIIGQILHAIDFEEPNLFCKWSIQFGKQNVAHILWKCNEVTDVILK